MMLNCIDRIKLLFHKDKELYRKVYNILGFYPHDIEYYRIAFAHSSSEYKGRNGRTVNNERLEFLGDAVLEMVVSDIVFRRFERKREGFLTGTRSKIVQRATLNQLAEKTGISKMLRTSMRATSHNSNIGGNAFEAFFGALYLDRGYRAAYRFFAKRILGVHINLEAVAKKEENFKSKLLEWSQKNRLRAEFKLDRTENNTSNGPVFYTTVRLEGLEAGKGSGYSKKESQQKAAKAALTKLKREVKFKDSIFEAKEKRTSMEAEEFAALPSMSGPSILIDRPAER